MPAVPPYREKVLAAAERQRLIEGFDLLSAPAHLLRRCHQRAREIFDGLIGNYTKLSRQQVALIIAVWQNPATTHARLSEATGFDRNTLADTLDRLIAKGLVTRHRSADDARGYDIRLTKAGAELLESIIPLSFEVQARIVEPLPPELRPVFVRCMRLMLGLEESPGKADDASESARPAATRRRR